MTLAERIAAARNRMGWKQNELAAECGWKWGSRIGNYEQGTTEPSLSDLARIADATGVSVVWLTTGAGEMISSRVAEAAAADSPLTEDEKALLAKYRSASPEARRIIQASATAGAQHDDDHDMREAG